MNIFITSQMRTGSTWLCDLVAGLFNIQWVFWEKGRYIQKEKFLEQIKKAKGNHVFKMHYTHPKTICECIPKGDKNNFVLSITRDIKDIAVSKILYMKYDKPMRSLTRLQHLDDMRTDFGNKDLPDKRYINKFIRSPHFHHIIRNWKSYNDVYSHPNYLLITYEELLRRRLFVMTRVCNFLGIQRSNKGLRQIIVGNNFQNKTGRKPGKKVNYAFRRNGEIGDHINYINKQNLQYIEELVNEHTNKKE